MFAGPRYGDHDCDSLQSRTLTLIVLVDHGDDNLKQFVESCGEKKLEETAVNAVDFQEF